MRSLNVPSVFLVVGAILLAGCSGPKEDRAPDPSASDVPDLLGGIVGTIVDDELHPVRDAQVAVASGVVESTHTDDAGMFLLQGLPPGEDTLYVAAIGFDAIGKRITILPGETQELTISMSGIATDEPFSMVESHQGFIACGSGAGLSGSGFTQVGCGANDPNQQFLFNYTFGKDLKGILLEMSWSPTQALSRDLVLNVEKDGCGVECTEEDTFAQLQGCCYLRIAVTIDDLVKSDGTLPATDFREHGGRIQTRTFPAFGEGGNPITVFSQQGFEIRAEYFYKDLPGDWSTRSNVLD